MIITYTRPINPRIVRQIMCTHVAHTSFFKKKTFFEKNSVVGTLCAVWVHILCLTIHFLAVQIWYFNVTKYQNRVSLQSRKVEGTENPVFWHFLEF